MLQPITLVRFRQKDGTPGPLVIPPDCGPDAPYATHVAYWDRLAKGHPVNESVCEHRLINGVPLKNSLFFLTKGQQKEKADAEAAAAEVNRKSRDEAIARQRAMEQEAASVINEREVLTKAVNDAINNRTRESRGLDARNPEGLAKLQALDKAIEDARKKVEAWDAAFRDKQLRAKVEAQKK